MEFKDKSKGNTSPEEQPIDSHDIHRASWSFGAIHAAVHGTHPDGTEVPKASEEAHQLTIESIDEALKSPNGVEGHEQLLAARTSALAEIDQSSDVPYDSDNSQLVPPNDEPGA